MADNKSNGFYSYYVWLCASKGVSSYAAYHAMDISKGTISKWRHAEEDGTDVLPSTKIALKLSDYFEIPTDRIYAKEDKYGLTQQSWAMMGSEFNTERFMSNVPISDIAKWSTLTEAEILNFEAGRAYIPADQLSTICGVLGVSPDNVFSPWIENIYEYEERERRKANEEKVDVPGIALGDFYVGITNDAFPPSKKGDLLAVQYQVTAENGDLLLVDVNGEQMLRRHERIGDTVLLRCDNPNYETIILAGKDAKNLRILGKAAYFIIKAV